MSDKTTNCSCEEKDRNIAEKFRVSKSNTIFRVLISTVGDESVDGASRWISSLQQQKMPL